MCWRSLPIAISWRRLPKLRTLPMAAAGFMRGASPMWSCIWGANGALVSQSRGMEEIPARNAGPVVDVTGAGDAAMAGLIHGLLQGVSISEAAVWGQAAAGLVVASSLSTLKDLPPGGLRRMVSR
ncbi:MAG: PfkB family carbohydrate kinase [Aestuariivirga sp.]